MDEQKVRELLDQAGREYNEGKYAEAIAHWQEVLTQDSGNQKAREGIRMAQLLVVNWEAEGGEAAGEISLAAENSDAETQEKIEFGMGRIRELMTSGRYQEALEGCQLLNELAPGMASVKHLLEEVTQVYEAQPFIKERLDRARRFLAQGKSKEAMEEAKNILSVDRGNAEAQSILSRAGGAPAAEKPKTPSAFQVEKTGKAPPPSPFSGGGGADALLAQFDFEESASAGTKPPAAESGAEPISLEPDFEQTGGTAKRPASGGASGGDPIRPLIDEGERLFVQKKYQAAIEIWSRVFGIDETNQEATALIDRAKSEMEDLARQTDEAYFRGVDAYEGSRLDEAKQAFEEVLKLSPDHADARSYIGKLGAPPAEPKPAAPPPASSKPHPAAAKPSSKAAAEAAAIPTGSVPLAFSRDEEPHRKAQTPAPATSAGPMKKKPVKAVSPGGGGRSVGMIALAGVILVAVGAGAWFFLFSGGGENEQGSETPPPAPAQAEAGGVAPAGGGAQAAPESDDKKALEVVPAAPPPPPPPADAAAIRKKVDTLMKEARALYQQQKYTEALDRINQTLSLDPAHFEADEMKTKASAAAAKQAKFNRELDAAKQAFNDGDWGGALYKLYRLREERKEMAELARYIENANYNWGIEALGGFELEGAREHFHDALEMDPKDAQALKHVEVLNRYKRRSKDAAFDAYVRSFKPRSLEER